MTVSLQIAACLQKCSRVAFDAICRLGVLTRPDSPTECLCEELHQETPGRAQSLKMKNARVGQTPRGRLVKLLDAPVLTLLMEIQTSRSAPPFESPVRHGQPAVPSQCV